MVYVFVFVCFSCVVSFQFKEFICIILFLCCCFFVTRLSGLFVCILWSFFLFCFLVVCFEFCLFFTLSFLRTFRALFPGRRTPLKIHQKSPPLLNASKLERIHLQTKAVVGMSSMVIFDKRCRSASLAKIIHGWVM